MAVPLEIKKISDTVWELPVTFREGMRVPARIYATEKLLKEMEEVISDLRNVCCAREVNEGREFKVEFF